MVTVQRCSLVRAIQCFENAAWYFLYFVCYEILQLCDWSS